MPNIDPWTPWIWIENHKRNHRAKLQVATFTGKFQFMFQVFSKCQRCTRGIIVLILLSSPRQVLGTPLPPAQGMEEHLRKVLLTRFPVLTIETIPLRGSINFKCEFGKYKEHKAGNFFFAFLIIIIWGWEGGGREGAYLGGELKCWVGIALTLLK